MRWRDHPGEQRRKELILLVDEIGATAVREFVLIGHRQGARRASLDAQATEDAAQVVDLVDAPVPLPRRESRLVVVIGALYVDGISRAGPGAPTPEPKLLKNGF